MIESLDNCILKIEHGIGHTKQAEDRAVGQKFLAALAPVLATLEVGTVTLDQLKNIERLFDQSWLKDEGPLGTYCGDWEIFSDQCRRMILGGMTVNERLFALGLLDESDRLAEARNWNGLRSVLQQVYLSPENIEQIVKTRRKKT